MLENMLRARRSPQQAAPAPAAARADRAPLETNTHLNNTENLFFLLHNT